MTKIIRTQIKQGKNIPSFSADNMFHLYYAVFDNITDSI